jgi:hypothetical protein
VPTFADRGVSRGQRGGSPTAVNLSITLINSVWNKEELPDQWYRLCGLVVRVPGC